MIAYSSTSAVRATQIVHVLKQENAEKRTAHIYVSVLKVCNYFHSLLYSTDFIILLIIAFSLPLGTLCLGCSVSYSRVYMMDRYDLASDPCKDMSFISCCAIYLLHMQMVGDNRLIRCINCLQMISCICDILAILIDSLRDAAEIMRW